MVWTVKWICYLKLNDHINQNKYTKNESENMLIKIGEMYDSWLLGKFNSNVKFIKEKFEI